MTVRLIRTDKNGTKYFEDTCCPKCGGSGYIYEYAHVEGGVCFQCGGSGWYLTHWKEMTPEYEAKLQARRDARNAKKEAEFNAHIAEHYNALGLNENGHAFAVMGNTFEHKDQLKALGARFNGAWWYFANPSRAGTPLKWKLQATLTRTSAKTACAGVRSAAMK